MSIHTLPEIQNFGLDEMITSNSFTRILEKSVAKIKIGFDWRYDDGDGHFSFKNTKLQRS